MKKQIFVVAACFVFLTSCTNSESPAPIAKESRRAQRQQEVQATLQAGPQVTSWQTAEGTVINLSIPRASDSGRFVEVKKCVVWRDVATRTASLHCDRDELDLSEYPSDPPDYSDYR